MNADAKFEATLREVDQEITKARSSLALLMLGESLDNYLRIYGAIMIATLRLEMSITGEKYDILRERRESLNEIERMALAKMQVATPKEGLELVFANYAEHTEQIRCARCSRLVQYVNDVVDGL